VIYHGHRFEIAAAGAAPRVANEYQVSQPGDNTMNAKSESNEDRKRQIHKVEIFIVALLLGAVLLLLYYNKFPGIPFKTFTDTDILAIVTSLFVVAVFMERSIEAILTPVRAPDRQKLKQELDDLRKAAETDISKKAAQRVKECELETYRLHTARWAYWLSFVFGLLISLVGIRTLAGLVEPTELEKLGALQRTLFSFVDIVLTGGVIAGGSAAIDKIGRKISEFYKLRSATTSDQPDQTDPK
jgi:hypothetical protein